MPDTREYTVGWLSAIPTELVAAEAFLDENHGEVTIPYDNNRYILGRIGGHNVVIASIPSQVYGTDSSAAMARDMLRSFPNVRFGLMVGIGGGAPSRRSDIRLGDVVVSTSSRDKSAVFEYDFGRNVQNEEFRCTRHLDNVPTSLRTGIAALEADYEMHGHSLNRSVEKALKKLRVGDRSMYTRPPPATDRLYKSDFLHPRGSSGNCNTTCGGDKTRLVARTNRNRDTLDPAIHYGVVASGNQLMKNALIRDKLAAKHGILCFEMEAAGLMNIFPCIVIRGICDYSDTHKNDAWQGFAAMTAAAYAKDLLVLMAPQRV